MTNTKWWDKKWGKNKLCGITKSRLRAGKNKDGQLYVTWLSCGHGFYTSALLEWVKHCIIRTSPTCPICRKSFFLI